jgi:hypothetical protein
VPIGGAGPRTDARPRHKGVADMKFRIYQHALTVMLAAYTLVHTFGAKWG